MVPGTAETRLQLRIFSLRWERPDVPLLGPGSSRQMRFPAQRWNGKVDSLLSLCIAVSDVLFRKEVITPAAQMRETRLITLLTLNGVIAGVCVHVPSSVF